MFRPKPPTQPPHDDGNESQQGLLARLSSRGREAWWLPTDLAALNRAGIVLAFAGALFTLWGTIQGDGFVSHLTYNSLVMVLVGAMIHNLVSEAEGYFETVPVAARRYIWGLSIFTILIGAVLVFQVAIIGTTISTQSTLRMLTVGGASVLGTSVFVIGIGELDRYL
jgi:hypothetical protein